MSVTTEMNTSNHLPIAQVISEKNYLFVGNFPFLAGL
jgi:hypothetical protein